MWVVATALNKESGYLCHCRNLCRTALEGGRECRENGYSCWLFGRFGVESSYYQYDIKSCLEDSILSKLNIPIIYDADFSHKEPCIPLINGSIAKVEVKNGKGKINFTLE